MYQDHKRIQSLSIKTHQGYLEHEVSILNFAVVSQIDESPCLQY